MTSSTSPRRHAAGPGETGSRAATNDRIMQIASRQLGLVTTTQLAACGLGRGAIAHRRRTRTLLPVAPGVFAVGRPPDARFARHLAATLSVTGDGWLSHHAAAEVWGLVAADERRPVDLLVIGTTPRPRPGVRLRRTQRLDPADRSRRGVLPVTNVARTIVDLGTVLSVDALERVTAEAFALHRCSAAQVRAAMDRAPGSRGTRVVRAVLERAEGPRRTRSEAERRFLSVVRAAGLGDPRMNVRIGGYEVDAVWPDERVIVEIDGYAFHGSRRRFERDRRRDAELQAAGWLVFRTTWRGITDEALATTARLASVLAVRRT